MTFRPELSLASTLRLETGWRLTLTPAGAHASPQLCRMMRLRPSFREPWLKHWKRPDCLIGPIPFRSIIRMPGIGWI